MDTQLTVRIAVVDDAEAIARKREQTVRDMGDGRFRIETKVYTDSRALIANLESREEFFDIILTDVCMPGAGDDSANRPAGVVIKDHIKELRDRFDGWEHVQLVWVSKEPLAAELIDWKAYEDFKEKAWFSYCLHVGTPAMIHGSLTVAVRGAMDRCFEGVWRRHIEHNDGLVRVSRVMQESFRDAGKFAASDEPVLLLGETGVGKEVFADHIHRMSERREKKLIAMNCAAIPPELFESELFGHEAGAFTGAKKKYDGFMMLADKSTLFLDEIGYLRMDHQAKLLRAIQEKEIKPVTGETSKVDVRFICATNLNLEQEIKDGRFQKDLFYRIDVLRLWIPPLRERTEDIVPLASQFLTKICLKSKQSVLELDNSAVEALREHNWPGNVRELENLMRRLAVLLKGKSEISGDDVRTFMDQHSSSSHVGQHSPGQSRRQLTKPKERDYFDLLLQCGFHIPSAAKALIIMESGGRNHTPTSSECKSKDSAIRAYLKAHPDLVRAGEKTVQSSNGLDYPNPSTLFKRGLTTTARADPLSVGKLDDPS